MPPPWLRDLASGVFAVAWLLGAGLSYLVWRCLFGVVEEDDRAVVRARLTLKGARRFVACRYVDDIEEWM